MRIQRNENREMLNKSGNLIKEVEFLKLDGNLKAANLLILVKKKTKNKVEKEYMHCNIYGNKVELARDLTPGDFVHVFGYYKENSKNGRTHRNFIIRHINKLDKTRYTNNEDTQEE